MSGTRFGGKKGDRRVGWYYFADDCVFLDGDELKSRGVSGPCTLGYKLLDSPLGVIVDGSISQFTTFALLPKALTDHSVCTENMASTLKGVALAAILGAVSGVTAQVSGSGSTTRYWDCCKPRYAYLLSTRPL